MSTVPDIAPDISYGTPTVLIFADSDAGLAAWRAQIDGADVHLGAALPIEAAATRLDEQSSVEAVLVDITRD